MTGNGRGRHSQTAGTVCHWFAEAVPPAGTGKTIAAQLIHRSGPRATAPFVSVNGRVIAVTSQHLNSICHQGRFRERTIVSGHSP